VSAAAILTGVMQQLGGPFNAVTLEGLEYWADSEGTPGSWNNPLATTQPGYGGVNVNSAGVKSYPTENDGISATVATLRDPAYAAVVAAIKDNKGLNALWVAVNQSPWCRNCQDGQYPVVLAQHTGAGGGTPPPGGTAPAPTGTAPAEANPGVPGDVQNAWAALGTRTGHDTGLLLLRMIGYQTMIQEARQ